MYISIMDESYCGEIVLLHCLLLTSTPRSKARKSKIEMEHGRIHGNPVMDGWAGAVMRKTLGIQKCDKRTDLPTDLPNYTGQGVESRVRN